MTDTVQVALIASIPATVAALASLVSSIKNGQKIKAIHEATNGMQTELREVSRVKGMADQREKDANDRK